MRILNEIEQLSLANETEAKMGLRNGMIVRTFLFTGLRVSELSALRIDDVYYGAEVKKFLVVRAECAKGGCAREIALAEKLREDFVRYRINGIHCGGIQELDPGLPLFPSFQDLKRSLTSRQVQRIVSQAGEYIGIHDLHPHTLRHTFATRLMKMTSIRTVQMLLGHKSLQSTQIYTHPSSDDCSKAVNGL